ncbi:hypothetical protein [Candidatus Accumulibacter sp. ACC012]|uniref:P-loop ATPase, Sll1717 family n=1 Tax=Candidatus Accumulibacter sp. ACC012 TaxID=2823332 RepID=UPI0025BCC2AE|nr:hypothetical protein [Candidatus Accumulibacter sp. ACC012]
MANIQNNNSAFVAYTSRDRFLANLISEGVAKANRKLNNLRYEPWEFNDTAGNLLISPVVDAIDQSCFIVADITYLNPNVVYEIGFSIGRSRRCFLVRHTGTDGDKKIARDVGIFDTLGFEPYETADELTNTLTAYVDPAPLPFSAQLDRRAPVYVVEPPTKGGIATVMTSRLKKARYKYRSFNPAEDARLSAFDAIRQVASSAGVMVSLLDGLSEESIIHNTRALFVAGLSYGMGKPTLLLAHATADVPLDVRDSVRTFTRPDDIVTHIASFSLEVTEHLQQADPAPLCHPTSLQSLQIGDPTAENEMTTLANYFLNTDQYSRALRGEVNLVVGRKGAGKTALFIQVRDKTRSDKRNVVVDLKPEGYQLLKLKEDILAHLTQGANHHLVTAFWEYLILLEITYKLLEKDRGQYKFNHEIRDLYINLERTYRVNDFSVEGDFSERLLSLSQRIAQDYVCRFGGTDSTKLTTGQVTELVYSHDVRSLRDQVSAYLAHKGGVWVLFDNLDKGWSTQGVDTVDAMVLRCLIDAGRKIERDMRKSGHAVHCIVFVRNDVYEHLMRQSSDYGKEMRVALDWTDPDMLRELLRLRLVSALGPEYENMTFEQIWPRLCVSHYKGEETSSYVIERALMRPRNVIKIFSHAKGFAANLNHQKIEETDLEKGVRAYSQDLLVELDHELNDVFPIARELLYHFLDSQPEMSPLELRQIISQAQISSEDTDRVIDFLLYYGIVGVRASPDEVYYIFNVNYDLKILQIRAARGGENTGYVMNSAFRPALGIKSCD